MLRAVANHNKGSQARIEYVLCPGLGTATGRMEVTEAARQMALAYHNFLHPTTNMTWPNLFRRNGLIQGAWALNPSKSMGLKFRIAKVETSEVASTLS